MLIFEFTVTRQVSELHTQILKFSWLNFHEMCNINHFLVNSVRWRLRPVALIEYTEFNYDTVDYIYFIVLRNAEVNVMDCKKHATQLNLTNRLRLLKWELIEWIIFFMIEAQEQINNAYNNFNALSEANQWICFAVLF